MFCLKCGTELATRFIAGRERLACPNCDFVYYRNPVPIAVAQATWEGQLLLVKRLIEPLKGYWAPPGGYVEYDESVEEALVREIKEETNLDLEIGGLLNVYSKPNTGIVFVAYRGRIVGGEPRPGEDAGAVAFFAPESLPQQAPPREKAPLEQWTFQVIQDIIEDFRKRGGG